MDVEGVVDEVLEIERTLQMDLEGGQTEPQLQDSSGPELEPTTTVQEHGVITMLDEDTTVEGDATTATELEEEEGPQTPSTSAEEGSPSTSTDGQEVTFVVQLNDEGAIMLDKSGVVPTDAEPHVYFPITLPAVKVKSENPLAGAKHFPTTRCRKSKPQAILYNDEIDQIYEMLPDGTLNTITTTDTEAESVPSMGPSAGMVENMDVIDFESRLLPKDYELMERVLASAEGLDLPQSSAKPTTSREYRLETDEVHYDHSYCAYPLFEVDKTRYKGKSKITVLPDLPAALQGNQDPSCRLMAPEDFDVLRPTIRPDGSLGPSLWEIHSGAVPDSGEQHEIGTMEHDGLALEDGIEGKATPDTDNPVPIVEDVKIKVQQPSHEGPTASDISARSRRSQRQQDRIERQEAERILAENQQMLQREKEMYGGKAPISPSPSGSTTSPPVATQIETLQPATPSPVATPASTEVTNKVEPSTDETPRRPYPKRQNRKLPAHLADPNYINLDDTEKKSHDEVSTKPKTEETDDKEVNEDDPNKLWCICQKPHNNRFMICCDTCEDWFHGKCVGITKAVGSKIDKWICPNCRKQTKHEKEALQTPVAKISKKSPKAGTSPGRGRRASTEKSPAKKPVTTPKKIRLSSTSTVTKDDLSQPTSEKPRERRLTESSQSSTSAVETPTAPGKCIICKSKQARPSSVFCSDECVVKHSHEAGGPPSTTSNPAKLKRSNSKIPDKEELENFLTFHLISPGVPKSTVVVPQKPKDATPPSPVKPPSKIPPPEPSSSNSSTNGKPVASDKSSITPSTSMKRGSDALNTTTEVKRTKLVEAARLPTKRGTKPTTSPKSGSTDGKLSRKRTISGSEKAKQKEVEKQEKPKKETEAEILAVRQTSRSKLTETFELRLKELSETERAEIPAENTPEAMSEAIEAELYNAFSTVNSKYLSKFRSILFNLKDSKNNLYKNISMNELKAKELVRLEPHQMASDELAQWRLNESKKELEMIKRSEIDKLQELKNQERIDAELGFEKIETAIGDDESRYLGVAHGDVKNKSETSVVPEPLTPLKPSSRTRSSPRGHRPHQGSKSSQSPQKSSKDSSGSKKRDAEPKSNHRQTRSSDGKEKKSDKTHSSESSKQDRKSDHKSDHHKSSSSRKHSSSRSTPDVSDSASKEKEKESSSSSRDKGSDRALRSRDHDLRSGDRKRTHSENEHRSESSRSDKSQSKNKKQLSTEHSHSKKGTVDGTLIVKGNTDTGKNKIPSVQRSQSEDTPALKEISKSAVADPTSIDQEPSSTIKTPDFSDENGTVPADQFKEAQKPVLSSKFTMPELGSFNATLYNVSHSTLDGSFFPSSPVPIVGRISPNTVWDYIDKMKKTKEVIILRLAPATPADTEGYMTFFTYFSSRTRLGVLGGISSPLKDVYLVPLDKHSPVNNALLPFHGPGLPRKRAHCLLAVVTRNFGDSLGQVSRRKLSTSIESPPKRMKLTSEIKPGLISSLNLPREGRTRGSAAAAAAAAAAANLTPNKSPSVEEKISPKDDVSQTSDLNEDDLPYTPWEEEEGTSPKAGAESMKTDEIAEPSEPKIFEQIKDLEAQIQQEKAAIENISLSLIATANTKAVPLVIPGLDGEFGAETVATAPLQFLRQLPETPKQNPVADSRQGPVIPVGTSQESSQSSKLVKVKERTEDDSAPYSPSQLELEEEES